MNIKEIKFDSVRKVIDDYSDGEKLKILSECTKTLNKYKDEKRAYNEYRKTAENFEKYKKNEGVEYEEDDYYFYMYLKGRENKSQYQFPLENGEFLTVNIDLLNPFDLEEKNVVNPRWHLLVCYYAYKDAAYNHQNDDYAKEIDKNKIKRRLYKSFKKNKVLCTWMDESIKQIL